VQNAADMTRWITMTPVPLGPTGTAGPELLELELSDTPSRAVTDITMHTDDLLGTRPGDEDLPGSRGEHLLQRAFGTVDRANRFYRDQVLDHLNDEMRRFVTRMDMAFIGTADGKGECDVSFRAGQAGFVQVLGERWLAYPEYRGNGVMASLGNISENAHVAMLMVDFVRDLIGLHVNGRARIVDDAELRAVHPDLPSEVERGRTPERWVVLEVVEAYIHCRKHIPRLVPVDRTRDWGTDDSRRKGGDYFGVRSAGTAAR
jgi:predicted pyridoxine 5'-phosphate oxidase superfamily flavin-nucleotide-binding protein